MTRFFLNKFISIFSLIFYFLISSTSGNNFFGIPILGEPIHQFNQIIHYLIEKDYDKAGSYLDEFKKSHPNITKEITLKNFTIPCVDCTTGASENCFYDQKQHNVIDKYALRYFLYKIDQELNNFLSKEFEKENKKLFEQAYNNTLTEFNYRKKQVLNREVFQGIILKINSNSFIIKNYNDEVFHLVGVVPSSAIVGQFYTGYYWKLSNKSHNYINSAGEKESIHSYTLNLWWDY